MGIVENVKSKGGFTMPGEAGYEKLTLELAEKWGADVIRDSDGTEVGLHRFPCFYLLLYSDTDNGASRECEGKTLNEGGQVLAVGEGEVFHLQHR